MITDALLTIIYYFILLILQPLRLLPDFVLSQNITDALSNASSYLTSFSIVLPVTTLFIVFGSVVTLEVILFTYKAIMWLIRRLPTQS